MSVAMEELWCRGAWVITDQWLSGAGEGDQLYVVQKWLGEYFLEFESSGLAMWMGIVLEPGTKQVLWKQSMQGPAGHIMVDLPHIYWQLFINATTQRLAVHVRSQLRERVHSKLRVSHLLRIPRRRVKSHQRRLGVSWSRGCQWQRGNLCQSQEVKPKGSTCGDCNREVHSNCVVQHTMGSYCGRIGGAPWCDCRVCKGHMRQVVHSQE